MHFPQEYSRRQTLFEIASVFGTPLTIDVATQERRFGLYARNLVDVDLSEKVFESVLVETDGLILHITVEYERNPPFCAQCKMLGHTLQNCLKFNPEGPSKPNQKVHHEKAHSKMKTHASLLEQ